MPATRHPQSAIANPQPSHAAWEHARLYLSTVRQSFRRFIAAQICLGWQLFQLKQELGFGHGGDRCSNDFSSGQVGHLKSWADWVQAEIDLPRRTADRFIEVFQGFQAHLNKRQALSLGGPAVAEPAALLADLATPPANLPPKDRAAIEKAIALASDGLTQRELIEELRLVKTYHLPGSGSADDDPAAGEPPNEAAAAEQLAFIFFTPALDLSRMRASRDWELHLQCLPLVTDDPSKPCLIRLEEDLGAALRDVRAVLRQKRSTVDV